MCIYLYIYKYIYLSQNNNDYWLVKFEDLFHVSGNIILVVFYKQLKGVVIKLDSIVLSILRI